IGEHAFYLDDDFSPRTDVDWTARQPWNEEAISFVSIARDRYASLTTPGRGSFVVRHGRRDGDRLIVNARARRGHGKVQVLDGALGPIAGLGLEAGDGFTGDSLRGEIAWRGRSLAHLPPDAELALRFVVEDADVFAYELVGGSDSP